ncbi:MAG TPA: UvrD-helicase domain-containing protein [Vicinamibacterales bacterium]|jgi:ATP-dependent helicase/nuclease subunit A
MSSARQPSLFDVATAPDPDAAARQFAVDPANNVVLEASAGTGKTSVLVARYVNLLKAGVDPSNILAITFTRKASAEMRERILHELRTAAARSEIDRARWMELRDRLGDIAISTIDAFCLSLLREFPLEADLDPGFEMADETEVPRLIEESLDRTLRILAALARTEPEVGLVFAQLGMSRTREGLAVLLDRRLVAWSALDRFLARGPSDLTAETVCQRTVARLRAALGGVRGGLTQFVDAGPLLHPRYQLLARELRSLKELETAGNAEIRAVLDRIAAHFLTGEGKPRKSATIQPYKAAHYRSEAAGKYHRSIVLELGTAIRDIVFAFDRDLNVVLARGIRRMFGVALHQYRRTLDDRSVLDFSDVLDRALELLRRMDEFSQSRFRLEARFHHVLVDEFQDTSRAQWELVALLIQSWGEGVGLSSQPSIFVVGDRKQSIYRFRDADAAVLSEAGRYIQALRPEGNPKRSIARSFRAVPTLLAFVNELFSEISDPEPGGGRFTYTEGDRFPPADDAASSGAPRRPALGVIASEDPIACAAGIADEIARILEEDSVRDKKTGAPRKALPGDIAILFRSRASHREFEHELERRGIPSYVYKGLGFFDADETKDLLALIRYLASPSSDLRAAAFLRSRFIRLSDRALAALAPRLAGAIVDPTPPDAEAVLDEEDKRVLQLARRFVPGWIAQVDRVPPAELVETILANSAYEFELDGPRRAQAWENLKKMRGLVRRIQNRGYATFPRIADHLDALTAGDESNAVLEAVEAVNLMTVHASKGLEFPIVFVVNLAKGASGPPRPVRVVVDGEEVPSVTIGPFVSEMDEADRLREKHETRRLLYVAATRARDRLYLSSALKDGKVVPGRGSLGEVLPSSIKELLEAAGRAARDTSTLTWISASGAVFTVDVCHPPGFENPSL